MLIKELTCWLSIKTLVSFFFCMARVVFNKSPICDAKLSQQRFWHGQGSRLCQYNFNNTPQPKYISEFHVGLRLKGTWIEIYSWIVGYDWNCLNEPPFSWQEHNHHRLSLTFTIIRLENCGFNWPQGWDSRTLHKTFFLASCHIIIWFSLTIDFISNINIRISSIAVFGLLTYF